MSHHSEDTFAVGSDSFWEPGNYKRTTKRIEDGHKLCGDLMTLVTERAEIEKAYSKQLKTWSAKWGNLIEKGPEYGTMEAAWKSILVEAERRAELHNGVKDDLLTKVNTQIKTWQKDNFHKSMMQLKEKKEMDDQFKKAQKPWAKHLAKVNKCKLDYHNACKNERTAINQERNANADSSLSQDQVRKLQDRVNKAKEQVQRCREQYEQALSDLNNYNPKYMEDMTDVFEKCQMMEGQRLQCFKEVLFVIQSCLNVSENPLLPQIYEEFYHTINNSDHEKDLRWWSNTHGVNMPMNWPQFEDYTEEFREIAGKSKKFGSSTVTEGPITLLTQRHVGDDLPHDYTTNQGQRGSHSGSRSKDSRNGTDLAVTSKTSSSMQSRNNAEQTTANRSEMSNGGDRTPFDEEDWDDHADLLEDDGRPGIKVRALYDYEAAESDELDFKAGDTFEKLEDEDEQGWCKGRKDGRVGLYPANYIEVIE